MSATQSLHFNWNPRLSTYNQLQVQRAQHRAANQNFDDVAASTASSFNDAMSSQAQGISDLAAQAAAKRLGITLPSQSGASTTATSAAKSAAKATTSSSAATNTSDYVKTINQIINGTASIASRAQSAIASAGSAQAAIANMIDGANIGGVSSATVGQIISGTANLATSAQRKISSDGNMFTTIDRIINTTLAPRSINVSA